MKKRFISLLIIGLFLSASFSLVAMNHMDGQGHARCPFEAAGVTDCAQTQNSLSFLVSHLNAFSKFLSAIPVNSFIVLTFLFLLLALAVLFTSIKLKLFGLNSFFTKTGFQETFALSNRISFTDWLAFHQNSPAPLERR